MSLAPTIVAVTHDQAEAMAMGTRVAVMADGGLRQVATPRRLYERPADTFVAGFIGNPPMNLLEMSVEPHDGLRLAAWCVDLASTERLGCCATSAGSESVVVGCRPEHIRVGATAGPDEVGFEATCDLVEYLGHRRLVHLHAADLRLVASIGTAGDLTAGEVVECAVPGARLHFFDTRPGSPSIRAGSGSAQVDAGCRRLAADEPGEDRRQGAIGLEVDGVEFVRALSSFAARLDRARDRYPLLGERLAHPGRVRLRPCP